MTSTERAQQFWSVLAFAAREQKVVSYEMLSQMTGMANNCGPLRANIRETPVVLLINEQGEKEKRRDEWHFS
jgi:hypothetical protein